MSSRKAAKQSPERAKDPAAKERLKERSKAITCDLHGRTIPVQTQLRLTSLTVEIMAVPIEMHRGARHRALCLMAILINAAS